MMQFQKKVKEKKEMIESKTLLKKKSKKLIINKLLKLIIKILKFLIIKINQNLTKIFKISDRNN